MLTRHERSTQRCSASRRTNGQADGYSERGPISSGGSPRQPAPYSAPALQRTARCRTQGKQGEGEHDPRRARQAGNKGGAGEGPTHEGCRGKGCRSQAPTGRSQAKEHGQASPGSCPPAGLRVRERPRQRSRAAAGQRRPAGLRGRARRRAHEDRALGGRTPAQGRPRATAAQLSFRRSGLCILPATPSFRDSGRGRRGTQLRIDL